MKTRHSGHRVQSQAGYLLLALLLDHQVTRYCAPALGSPEGAGRRTEGQNSLMTEKERVAQHMGERHLQHGEVFAIKSPITWFVSLFE